MLTDAPGATGDPEWDGFRGLIETDGLMGADGLIEADGRDDREWTTKRRS
jgi:hypothetical protein